MFWCFFFFFFTATALRCFHFFPFKDKRKKYVTVPPSPSTTTTTTTTYLSKGGISLSDLRKYFSLKWILFPDKAGCVTVCSVSKTYMWTGTIRKSQRKKALYQSFQCIIYQPQGREAAKTLNIGRLVQAVIYLCELKSERRKKRCMMIKSMCAALCLSVELILYVGATCMLVVVMTSIHKGFWYLQFWTVVRSFTVFMSASPPMLFWPVQKHQTSDTFNSKKKTKKKTLEAHF